MAERLPELANGKSASALGVKSPDLLSKFLAAHEAHPEFMNETLVRTMAVSMAFAGSETTAISLSAVFYFLLKHPAALKRLRAEIDEAALGGAFADSETGLVTWHESQRLPYLDACIKEAFRLHPAAGLPLERVVPKGGAEIAGHFVPGGTIVGCSAWLIHMNKNIFGEDAESYRPERWLPNEDISKVAGGADAEDRRIKEMNGTMFQFGMGSRTCIGKNISLLEIYKLVPTMLRRFEVCCSSTSRSWPTDVPYNGRFNSETQPKSGSWLMHGLLNRRISRRLSSYETLSNLRTKLRTLIPHRIKDICFIFGHILPEQAVARQTKFLSIYIDRTTYILA